MLRKVLAALTVVGAMTLIGACEHSPIMFLRPQVSGTIAVQAVRDSGDTAPMAAGVTGSVEPSFTMEPDYVPGYVDAGVPDYLAVTLREVRIHAESAVAATTIWSGSKELTLDGSDVDVSDINSELRSIPLGSYEGISLQFDSIARIKGTLTGRFLVDGAERELTVYTDSRYPYDAVNGVGGAASYSDFTDGPAEEMEVWIGHDGDRLHVYSHVDFEITENSAPQLTLLFDLNRLLRFYNGQHPDPSHGGVNPADPTDRAYFFAHSVFSNSVAAFLGEPGSIEGYQAFYAELGNDYPHGVRAWMTLVYGPDDSFLAGHLNGDDDNALTVAKGAISTYTPNNDGTVDFTYVLDGGATVYNVEGFVRQSSLGDRTPTALYDGYNHNGEMRSNGEAEFVLRYRR